MWFGYPVAILIAYCVFLILLRVWLFCQRPRSGINFDVEPLNADINFAQALRRGGEFKFSGAVGDAGGGGAGGSWEESLTHVSTPASGMGSSSSSSGIGDLNFDSDAEGLWSVVAVIVVILGALAASLYVVYIAPALLTEILIGDYSGGSPLD